MKKIQTAWTASQGAGEPRKKRTALVVLILCVLLLAGTTISAAVLGESLSRFSREESHVIALAPEGEATGEATPHADRERPKRPENPGATSSTAAPRSTTSFRQVAAENNNTAAQTGEYHGQLRVYDAVQSWSTETQVDLFRESYNESGDETVTAEDGKKLIAPGTSNLYEFMLENNGNLPLDYTISLKVENDHEGADIPLEWRLLAGNGSAVSDWRGYSATAEVMQKATLSARRLDKYSIQWRWDFERGGQLDRADTELGDLAAIQPLGAKATIIVYAEGNIEQGPYKGPQTGDASDLGLYILLMTVSGGGLLILFQSERRRKKREGYTG